MLSSVEDMKPRARLVLAGSLAALLFIAAVTAAILVLEPYKQRLGLPGGQTVSLERVDYGTVHPFVADPWWERLRRALLRRPPVPRAQAFYTASTSLGWSRRVQDPGVGPGTVPWMSVVDEHGCSFGGPESFMPLVVSPNTTLWATATGTVPRRAANVRVAAYGPNSGAGPPAGYLVLPNPTPGRTRIGRRNRIRSPNGPAA